MKRDKKNEVPFQTGMALSPQPSGFGPLVFSGKLKQGLQTISAHGFTHVELSIRSLEDVNPKELITLLQKLNLKVSALATGQACLFDSLCLSAREEYQRERAVEHLKKIIVLARDLGSLNVIIGGIRGRLSGTPDQQKIQFEAGVDSIKQCAEWASIHGITLLIEPINRYEMNWVLSAQDGLDLIERIALDSLKLLLDTFHMNLEENSTLDAFKLVGDRLGYVHIADNTRQAPGTGQIDFKSMLIVLEKMRYEGPVIAEILPLPDDLTAVQKTAEFWQSCF